MKRKVRISDHQSDGNAGHGINVASGDDVTIERSTTRRNGKGGVLIGNNKEPWHKKPWGAVLIAVTSGVILLVIGALLKGAWPFLAK